MRRYMKYLFTLCIICLAIGLVALFGWLFPPKEGGHIYWLGTLGGDKSGAFDISANGKIIVGYSTDANGQLLPVRWVWFDKEKKWIIEPIRLPKDALGAAYGVSPSGRMVVGGVIYNPLTHQKENCWAFCWAPEKGVQLLPYPFSKHVSSAYDSFKRFRSLDFPFSDLAVSNDERLITGRLNDDCLGYWMFHQNEWHFIVIEYRVWKGKLRAILQDGRLLGGQMKFRPVVLWKIGPKRWRTEFLYPDPEIYGTVNSITSTSEGIIAVGGRNPEHAPADMMRYQAVRWIFRDKRWQELLLTNDFSIAYDISKNGKVIVGTLWNRNLESYAFYWTPDSGLQVMDDRFEYELGHHALNQLMRRLSPRVRLSSLTNAYGVSADGRYIVGEGYNSKTKRREAYVVIR